MSNNNTGRSLAESLSEARWAYERRHGDRLSYQAIADLAARPVAEGGRGQSMALGTVRRRVKDYSDTLAVVADDETREEQRAAELADLDLQQRAFVALLGRVDEAASLQRAFAMNTTIDALRDQRPDLLVLRDEKLIMRALENLRSVGESRRRLMGTDAPQRAEIDLTARDGILDELNASLATLGLDTVTATP